MGNPQKMKNKWYSDLVGVFLKGRNERYEESTALQKKIYWIVICIALVFAFAFWF